MSQVTSGNWMLLPCSHLILSVGTGTIAAKEKKIHICFEPFSYRRGLLDFSSSAWTILTYLEVCRVTDLSTLQSGPWWSKTHLLSGILSHAPLIASECDTRDQTIIRSPSRSGGVKVSFIPIIETLICECWLTGHKATMTKETWTPKMHFNANSKCLCNFPSIPHF